MIFRSKEYRPNPFFGRDAESVKLTFCITHKAREEYLKQTLATNLQDNMAQANVDFVLVDFSSDLSVASWVKSAFRNELNSGKLQAYHCAGLPEWHASKAKNCAHSLAQGDILVNLDCDNFTGPEGGQYILRKFLESQEELVLWQNSRKKLDGSYGRIALFRSTFYELGGYNESFLPMGFQDGDLIKRAEASKVRIERDRNALYNMAIKHNKFVPKDMTWKKMNEHNQGLSRSNIKAGALIANEGVFGALSKDISRID